MYNFDEIIPRENTNSVNYDGWSKIAYGNNVPPEIEAHKSDYIRMWIADMDFATPDFVRNGIKMRLDKKILGYSNIFDKSYYDAFLSWCQRRYDWTFNPDHLVTSNGIVPAIIELVDYITDKADSVTILTPSYGPFEVATKKNNRSCIFSNLIKNEDKYEIDFDDLDAKTSDKNCTLLIFCNPHNPSGRVWSQNELEKLADIIRKNNLWVISDEIHCDLTRVGIKHTPLDKVMPEYNKLVTCMSCSKSFNSAGLMFSNIIIKDDTLRSTWLEKHHTSENPLSIAGAEAAYLHGDVWLDELRSYLDKNFNYLDQFLKENIPLAKFSIPEATYLAWIDLSAYFGPSDNICKFFADSAKVVLEDGNSFVANATSCVRLNIACPNSILEEGLKRMAKALETKI